MAHGCLLLGKGQTEWAPRIAVRGDGVGLGIVYPRFVHSSNLAAVLLTASPYILASIGSTYLLIGGNVDLSIGAQWALDGMVVAFVAQTTQSADCSSRLWIGARAWSSG